MLRILNDYAGKDEIAHLVLDSAHDKGAILAHSTTDEDKLVASTGDEFLILMHDVKASIDAIDRLRGVRTLATTTGNPCTVKYGPGKYIVTDNISTSNGTPAVDDEITVLNGKIAKATSSDKVWGKCTAVDYDGNSGEYRFSIYSEPNTLA